ncbi:hypothetical protein OBO34_11260 [Clostridiales Family XIII bacterium ASD5510]|uniref:Uncharacterized protein n=1 Tax=Hominibacterium faecale TaxID=2839743 RepID=A0A9J6QW66_9FIRM|nr:hypothetical protein [Hominibacterium faecale]MCU7378934.1 hypothetical protein [Hominibacterium faecale]
MKKQITKDIIEQLEKLPEHMQAAFFWAIKNLELVKEMCKVSDMSSEEIEYYLDVAMKKEDHYLYTLMLFKKIYDEERISQGLDSMQE